MEGEAKRIAREAERVPRPDIVDRNGVVLATDVSVASLFADPRKILDIEEAVELISTTLPDVDAADLKRKFTQPGRAFVWIKRQVSPEERDAVYNLGIPGVAFVNERKRVYPQGRLTSHTVGLSTLIPRALLALKSSSTMQGRFILRLLRNQANPFPPQPSCPSMCNVQHAMVDELQKSISKFKAVAGGAIVMDIETGEILALASLT